MKAINLIPADAQRVGGRSLQFSGATYGVLGVLAAGLVLVTFYVLAGNSVSSRRAELTMLQSQLTQAQSEASRLGGYGKFAQLAQTRLQSVRGIAATRFDWHAALAELAEVVPANTSLQSLSGTVVPGATAGGGGGGQSSLRADLPGPAFDITGCTGSQDDVARLISRLRAMNDVTRVALGTSQKGAATAGAPSPSGSGAGCKPGSPTFQMTVFFNPVPGAGATGAASLPTGTGSTAAAAPATGTAAATPTTPVAPASTTAAPTTSSPAGATPTPAAPAAPAAAAGAASAGAAAAAPAASAQSGGTR